MHDPMTVAFELNFPWKKESGDSFATIWHIDPEVGGDDDSCDWFGGRLTSEESAKIKAHAKAEHEFFFGYEMVALQGADPLSVILASWRSVKWALYRDRSLPHQDLVKVMALATTPGDNLRCYAEIAEADLEAFEHLLMLLARQIKRLRRPWYRHPKWHIYHWKIQLHPWERLRRYLFDRCAGCGGRFSKGSPHWKDGKLYHGDCCKTVSPWPNAPYD